MAADILYIGPPARWPCLVAAARYSATAAGAAHLEVFLGATAAGAAQLEVFLGATAAGAARLEVFLTGTARKRQCFGESDPARDRHGDR